MKRNKKIVKKNLTIFNFIYNTFTFYKKCLCGYRLVVRTSGFHPGNRGSIPRSHTICIFVFGI